MTTELYNDGTYNNAPTYEERSLLQQTWLIKEIIKPELPNVMDHVEKCINQLSSPEKFRMPLTNGNSVSVNTSGAAPDSTSIKGTITRQAGYIVDFQAIIKLPDFNRGKPIVLKMDLDKQFPLVQINAIIKNLSSVLSLFDELQQLSELHDMNLDDIHTFHNKIGKILELLTQSITLLQNPPRELVFPHNNNSFLNDNFSESHDICESAHHLVNMELVLFKNEICLDIRNLTKVIKKPWSEIDSKSGLSFSDKVRDRLKQERNGKIVEILKEEGLQVEQTSVINNLISSFSATERITLPQASDLLARCVTFNGRVVTECEKVSITTSDPTLISVSAKLNGLENKISNHFVNIQNLS
ncbi:Rav2 [Kluyveromyces lactis]|nr:Rav2 [Kluyveromyces lactis]